MAAPQSKSYLKSQDLRDVDVEKGYLTMSAREDRKRKMKHNVFNSLS